MNSKTVLITGATSGIGEALFEQFNRNGDRVIGCGRNEEKLEQLQQSSRSGELACLAFDMIKPDEIAAAAEQLGADTKLDILVLNAGDCRYIDDAKQFDGGLFADIIATNLQSLGWLLQAFLPKVRAGGQVIFISSSATIVPFPRAEAYGASKAGMDYLANSLRLDLKRAGIDVTLVHPGFIKTPLTDKNDFAMPFLMSSAAAADRIYTGIAARKRYLHFPRRLTWLLKLFALLPAFIWRNLITRSA